jgi:putative acetyltransferase
MLRVPEIYIRPFEPADLPAVRDLFIEVHRVLVPPAMQTQFDRYIRQALSEEIDRLQEYYAEREGSFWVALLGDCLVGNFGLEQMPGSAMKLRRMYVDVHFRRHGIGRHMLRFAEETCLQLGASALEGSTTELQPEAMRLFQSLGYRLARDEIANERTSNTLGSGIRRYFYRKELSAGLRHVGFWPDGASGNGPNHQLVGG